MKRYKSAIVNRFCDFVDTYRGTCKEVDEGRIDEEEAVQFLQNVISIAEENNEKNDKKH